MINYRIGANFVEILVDSLRKFLLGFDTNAFQHLFGHLTEETLYEFQPGVVLGRKHIHETTYWPYSKVVLNLFGFVFRMIVTNDPDHLLFGIDLIKLLQQGNEVGALMSLATEGRTLRFRRVRPSVGGLPEMLQAF